MNALPSAQHTLEKRDLFPLLIHIISELWNEFFNGQETWGLLHLSQYNTMQNKMSLYSAFHGNASQGSLQ